MNVAEIRSRYWSPLEASHRPFAWETLNAAYGGSGRAYHGWGHIFDLFEGLAQVSGLVSRVDLVANAIFWHDAVYLTHGADRKRRADVLNVRDSAKLFRRYTLLSVADAVHEMIMAKGAFLEALLTNQAKLFRRPTTITKWRKKALSNIARCLQALHTADPVSLKRTGCLETKA